jgi:putative ABC transport system permease protein
VKPASGGAYLKESDLQKLKGIFWANNITDVSPELDVPVIVSPDVGDAGLDGNQPLIASTTAVGYWFNHPFNAIRTGAPALHPWWKLVGQWPSPTDPTKGSDQSVEIIAGAEIARQLHLHLGDQLSQVIKTQNPSDDMHFKVSGIVTTGDSTDGKLLLSLVDAQSLAYGGNGVLNPPGASDAISRVEISARTKPEDAFARKDPETLSPQDHEIWYCRPYANSIAYQIREAIPGAQAEQVRRVEQNEGNVLKRISGLMWLISAAALLAAGFAVSAAMATAILERRGEIGLMRSLGASKGAIAFLFYTETGLLAILGGTLGYLAGSVLAAWLGARIFAGDGGVAGSVLIPVLLPVVVALALVVALAGSTPSILAALRMEPSAILREDA